MAGMRKGVMHSYLARVVEVEREEVDVLLWSCLYFFFVLGSYYILRPLRDEMALASGVRNLPWLFTATLLSMLLVNPLFSRLVARFERRRFIPITYRFFNLNLLLFFFLFLLATSQQNIWLGRVFYVWTSVFNLFVVSIFWALMVDAFRSPQGKRLFGFIAVGGTLGAITGSAMTAFLAELIGPISLMLIAIVLLELAVQAMRRVVAARSQMETSLSTPRAVEIQPVETPPADLAMERPVGGGSLSGITRLFQSRYLAAIAGYMLLFTITATFLYFQQAEIIEESFQSRAARTSVFARIDLAVNLLTVLTQFFFTGRIIKTLGIALTLAALPVVCALGFSLLWWQPVLLTLVFFQVVRRAGDYAIARPARETLYTVVSREDKYKAKTLIDTFVYRTGDQLGAWSYAVLLFWGFGLPQIALLAVALSLLWLVLGLWLGKEQESFSAGY